MTAEINYRANIIEVATELVGSPSIRYIRDHPELGQSPDDGFDCSGFVRYVLTQAGLHIPDYIGQDRVTRQIRHVNEFWQNYGYPVDEDLSAAGDLLFSSENGRIATHVGFVLGPESYVQAPGHDDTLVQVSPIRRGPTKFNDRGRRLYLTNPIGFRVPEVLTANPDYRYHRDPLPA